jgi:hypothetical protein
VSRTAVVGIEAEHSGGCEVGFGEGREQAPGRESSNGCSTRARKQRTSTGRGSRQVCREQILGQELRTGVGADIDNGVGCEEMGQRF